MRLDRYLANATGISRNQVQRAIRAGDALINGAKAQFGSTVHDTDCVTLHGQIVNPAKHCYLALHKPAGYICANSDADHPTVIDLVSGHPQAQHPTESLQIAGRLDMDTTGLVLLTTDGQWNHKVTSANGKCLKTYEVNLAQAIADADLRLLEAGITLRSEPKPTRPCSIERLSARDVTITLGEGKYHQVKRMFAAVGNRVTALHRRAIGDIRLDQTLRAGQFRVLTDAEISSIN